VKEKVRERAGRNILFATIFILLLAGISCAQSRILTVDGSRTIGFLRSFQGVNCGPAPFMPGLADVSRQYRELGIDLVRVHDFFGPGDVDAQWEEPLDPISRWVKADGAKSIFPNWEADPEKESSYNFGPTDRIIRAIVASGAEVYFRLGRSWGAKALPPSDMAKFANVCKHIVMHYNGEWAKGYRYNIRYWEIWNEPDLKVEWAPNFIRPFWTGTPGQFYELYEQVARAIKGYENSLKVGGPAKARPELADPYREGFLQYCADRKVPLDFYSWHLYQPASSLQPYLFIPTARSIRDLLDKYGFNKAESILSEWNMTVDMAGTGGPGQNTMKNAAFISAAMTYFQDGPIDRALFYRGDPTVMGLFEPGGQYRKKAYVFKFWGEMQNTPQRLAVSGGDEEGFAVSAGKSADGGVVRVVITRYNGRSPAEYKLTVLHLPWGEDDFEIRRYAISERPSSAAEPQKARGGKFEVNGRLPVNSVEMFVLQKQ
jgi:xylan 1,4-beta-xylosidase